MSTDMAYICAQNIVKTDTNNHVTNTYTHIADRRYLVSEESARSTGGHISPVQTPLYSTGQNPDSPGDETDEIGDL